MEDVELAPLPAPPVRPPPRAFAPPPVRHAFEFGGDTREYFRIWIVNLALGIVTLGIYSAWAKIRTFRYFYANTTVGGATFDYHARPWPILKGRLIAVALFGTYVLAGQMRPGLQIWPALLIGVLTPFFVVRGAAFRARYSSWRGIHFRFVPDYPEAYVRYLLLYVPIVLTLGLFFPYAKRQQKAFIVENHRFGGKWFKFECGAGPFYTRYLIAWGVMVAWMFVVFGLAWTAVFFGSHPRVDAGAAPPPMAAMFAIIGLSYAGYFAVWIFLATSVTNLVYERTRIDDVRFESTLSGARMLWIYFSNTLAIVASVGLLIPWAMIRIARYRAAHLVAIVPGDLDAFVAEARREEDAVGAEVDGMFDIDIGI